jgi:uracil-DNA glycosylase family 4
MTDWPQPHPGWRFFSILTQYYDYVQQYEQFGVEGFSRAPAATSHQGARIPSLESLRASLTGCKRCKLHAGRTHIVFGTGNPDADLVFVGEAPGYYEDKQGEPFVGKAGELLTRIIQAIGLRREDVYITNIIKCRPPNNRDPEPDEISQCEPFLRRQFEIIHPKIICALGRIAAQTLLQTTLPISSLRGRFHEYHGIQLLPTYHPAYLLRHPEGKRLVWQDMQLVQREYQRRSRATDTHSQST